MPDILTKARRSIQGKVSVAVRVHADAYGTVREATLEPPAASRYFSTAVQKAVRRWKFRPVKTGDSFVPQEWVVRFEFTRANTKVAAERTSPVTP
jgi:TonB family protein